LLHLFILQLTTTLHYYYNKITCLSAVSPPLVVFILFFGLFLAKNSVFRSNYKTIAQAAKCRPRGQQAGPKACNHTLRPREEAIAEHRERKPQTQRAV
jgi:hypothetical protein